MERILKIGGKTNIRIKATAGVLIRYKQQFGREYMDDLLEVSNIEDIESESNQLKIATIGYNLLWAMAKTADNSTPPPEEFLNLFDRDIMKIMPFVEVAEELFKKSMDGIRDFKNSGKSDTPIRTEHLIALSSMSGFNTQDIDNLSISMLFNSIGEYWEMKTGGTDENGVREATQADIDAFFGR